MESGRRRTTMVVGFIAAVLLAAGVAALVAGRTASNRIGAERRLERAMDRLRDADEVVVAVDETLAAPIDSPSATPVRELTIRFPDARRRLEDAISLAEDARRGLPESKRQVAAQVALGARARLDMLDAAEPLLAAREDAAAALQPAREGWDSLRRAESLTTSATERFNRHTKADVSASAQLSERAAAAVASATASLEMAESRMPSASIEPYIEYARDRAELVRRSRDIDDLWLAGRVEEANTRLEAFNREERRLVERARELTGTPTQAIADAYETATASPARRYYRARGRAQRADMRIADLADE